MRSPQPSQQAVNFEPPLHCFPGRVMGHSVRVNRDLLETLGFGGLKRRDDPSDNIASDTKLHSLEFRALGNVEGGRYHGPVGIWARVVVRYRSTAETEENVHDRKG